MAAKLQEYVNQLSRSRRSRGRGRGRKNSDFFDRILAIAANLLNSDHR